MRSVPIQTLVLTGLFGLATTALPGAAAPTGDPVVVGAILSISGLYAPLGEPERNALQLAEKDINAHGGIAGRPLQIVIQDDEGKADTAAQLATSFAGQHVAALIGGSLTPTSGAIARVAGAANLVQIYMTPTATIWNPKTGIQKHVFEATPRNELEAQRLLSYAKSKLGAKKIAILHDDAPYGSTGSGVVAAEAQNEGLPVVDDEPFPITATDVTAQLGKIKASGADTVLIWTASPTGAIAVRQMRQLGLNLNIVGSTGIVSDNFLRVTGKDGDGVYSDMDLNVTHPNAQQRAFLSAYRAAYHARPNNFASFGWDAAHLAARALDKTKGNSDAAAVESALLTLPPYAGTTGTYRFTDSNHNGMSVDDVHIAIDKNAVWFTQ
jgi:branched-chain amino acid transport system substrate-binding protein